MRTRSSRLELAVVMVSANPGGTASKAVLPPYLIKTEVVDRNMLVDERVGGYKLGELIEGLTLLLMLGKTKGTYMFC